MEKEELIDVPATTRTVCTQYCDVCGNKITDKSITDSNARSAVVECNVRYTYTYDDWRTELIDLCEECFVTKVQPLLEKEFNIKFREC
jgi:hypothetical protein